MRSNQNISKSILVDRTKLNQSNNEKMINITLHSDDRLGVLLSDRHLFVFKTWCGEVNSMKTYMDYISTPDYPVEILSKKKIDRRDLKKISNTRKINIPNFWALVVLGMIDKVKACEELKTLLKENELDFTSINDARTVELFGVSFKTRTINSKMGRYLAVCRLVSELVKSGDIDDEKKVEYWVNLCKDNPECDLVENVPFVGEIEFINNTQLDSDTISETTSEE